MISNTDTTADCHTSRQIILDEVRAMSNDELRVKVAELCGWVFENDPDPNALTISKEGVLRCRLPKFRLEVAMDLLGVPNYPADLNAMHEAEKAASMGYADTLREIVARDAGVASQHLCDQYLIHATARQRAEAFVLTLQC